MPTVVQIRVMSKSTTSGDVREIARQIAERKVSAYAGPLKQFFLGRRQAVNISGLPFASYSTQLDVGIVVRYVFNSTQDFVYIMVDADAIATAPQPAQIIEVPPPTTRGPHTKFIAVQWNIYQDLPPPLINESCSSDDPPPVSPIGLYPSSYALGGTFHTTYRDAPTNPFSSLGKGFWLDDLGDGSEGWSPIWPANIDITDDIQTQASVTAAAWNYTFLSPTDGKATWIAPTGGTIAAPTGGLLRMPSGGIHDTAFVTASGVSGAFLGIVEDPSQVVCALVAEQKYTAALSVGEVFETPLAIPTVTYYDEASNPHNCPLIGACIDDDPLYYSFGAYSLPYNKYIWLLYAPPNGTPP